MKSLFTRVFLSFWLAILAFAVAATAITAVNFVALASEPRAVTLEAEEALRTGGIDALKRWLAARNAKQRGQRTLVIDESGREILGQAPPRRPGPPDERGPAFGRPGPPMPPPGADRGPPGARIRALDGSSYVVLFDPPPKRGPFSPPFSAAAQAVLFGLAIAISGLVSYLLARSISRPLQSLQGAAKQLASGRLASRTSPEVAERSDEIGDLAREFDAMAERLSALVTARQQLLRDLSHELRSPLARLQMAVDLARQSSPAAAAPLDRIEREGERLEGLIRQILQYARLERDPGTLSLKEVDLAEIIQEVVHDAEFESQAAPGRIGIVLPEDAGALRMRADPQLLHAALDNLVRNALRHGGDGVIEVSAERRLGSISVGVRDHGPGVPDPELERIFEPFYRVAVARTERARDGGGIGLAVAAKAVELHGGCIVAANAADGGLRMTIDLPVGG